MGQGSRGGRFSNHLGSRGLGVVGSRGSKGVSGLGGRDVVVVGSKRWWESKRL